MRFSNRVVIVTGSSDGIGKAAALRFAREGASVVLNARRLERLNAVADELSKLGCPSLVVAGDVADKATAQAVIQKTVERFGRIDALVNNAGGGGATKRVDEVTEEDWDRVLNKNLKSAFLFAQSAARVMREQRSGKIVNVGSTAGRSVSLHQGPQYTSAKAGLLGLTRHLARDLGPFGINVNTVNPGIVMVPNMVSSWNARTEENRKKILGAIPLGRLAEPEDISGVIAFLASDDASYVTGAFIDANGGAFMA